MRSLYDERAGDIGPAVLMLLAAVGLVLAMACTNIMSVVLARSESRTHEFGLRRALGCGAVPLARLVLIETFVLGVLGALSYPLLALALLYVLLEVAVCVGTPVAN